MPEQQQYSDLPPGASLIHDPAQAQQFSDLPPGAKVVPAEQAAKPDVTPLDQQGAVRRFATRALSLPDRMFDHPGDYLNPFSKGYWDTAKQERSSQDAPPRLDVPGKQTIQDIKAGNYAGAAGDVLPPALQIAALGEPLLRGGVRSLGAAMENNAGRVGEFAAHPIATPVRAAVRGTTGATGRLLQRMAGPAPTLNTAPAASAGALDSPVVQAAAAEPAPAPYRMSGQRLVDAVTVTPRQIIPPSRQLPAYVPPAESAGPPVSSARPAPYRLSGAEIPDSKTVTPVTPRQPIGPDRMLPAYKPATRVRTKAANSEVPIAPGRGTFAADPRTHEQMLEAAHNMTGGGQGKVAMQEGMEGSAPPVLSVRPGFGTAEVPIEERPNMSQLYGKTKPKSNLNANKRQISSKTGSTAPSAGTRSIKEDPYPPAIMKKLTTPGELTDEDIREINAAVRARKK